MADLGWTPIKVEPAIPWGWNPAATFVAAYNQSAENRRAQEKASLDMEIQKILFPLKVQTAQMEFEKLVQDRDRAMLINERIREGRRIADPAINSAISGASGDVVQPQQQNNSIDWNAYGKTKQTDDTIIAP